jgi:hypothetical protein
LEGNALVLCGHGNEIRRGFFSLSGIFLQDKGRKASGALETHTHTHTHTYLGKLYQLRTFGYCFLMRGCEEE